METKTMAGIAGGLALAFVLAFAFQSLSAYREPSLLVINQTTSVTGVNNTASCDSYLFGFCIFAQQSHNDLQFKKILSNDAKITVTSNSSNIIFTCPSCITSDIVYSAKNSANTNYQVYANTTSNTFYFRVINAGTGISISNTSSTITLSNSGVITGSCSAPISCSGTNPLSISCSSCITNDQLYKGANTVSTNFQIFKNSTISGTTTTLYFRTITSGTGISMSNDTNTVTITNTGVISNSCSTPISCSGTNPSSISCSTCNTDTNSSVYNMLCQSSLNSNQTSLSCANFPARKHLVIQVDLTIASTGTSINPSIRFNGDTGNNYAGRQCLNLGCTSTTQTSTNKIDLTGSTEGVNDKAEFTLTCLDDQTSVKKGCWWMGTGSIGVSAGTAPFNAGGSGTWANTSAQITNVTLIATNGGTAKFASPNTRLTIWGYD